MISTPLNSPYCNLIQGFLRRVHRWPILLPPDSSQLSSNAFEPTTSGVRKRGQSLSGTPLRFPTAYTPSPPTPDISQHVLRGRSPQSAAAVSSLSPDLAIPSTAHDVLPAPVPQPVISVIQRARRASAAEKVLEQLRSRDIQKGGVNSSPRTSWLHYPKDDNTPTATPVATTIPAIMKTQESPTRPIGNAHPIGHSASRRQSLISPPNPPPSPVLSKAALTPARPRLSRSPSVPQLNNASQQLPTPPFPPELLLLLDGEHHTDDLGVRFEVGWPVLEKWLIAAGGGQGDGDYGRVSLICR